jgi:hypothetical protein
MPFRETFGSWWIPVYSEVLVPPPDPLLKLTEQLSSTNAGNGSETLLVFPEFEREIIIFYVGHKYLVVPDVISGSECDKAIIRRIGASWLSEFNKPAKFLIFVHGGLETTPAGYHVTRIPFFRKTVDASRPELTRHGFAILEERKSGYISVYERKCEDMSSACQFEDVCVRVLRYGTGVPGARGIYPIRWFQNEGKVLLRYPDPLLPDFDDVRSIRDSITDCHGADLIPGVLDRVFDHIANDRFHLLGVQKCF